MQTATIHGIEMGYRDEGDGTPLVLVHGFPLSGAMWQPQISTLSARYRVIAPDLRGFGASAFGKGVDSLDQYADDLLALLDHLDMPQVALAGLSMGGYIAFALLRRAADRVSALVLADTKAAADSDEARQKREQNARMVETRGLEPPSGDIEADPPGRWGNALERKHRPRSQSSSPRLAPRGAERRRWLSGGGWAFGRRASLH